MSKLFNSGIDVLEQIQDMGFLLIKLFQKIKWRMKVGRINTISVISSF